MPSSKLQGFARSLNGSNAAPQSPISNSPCRHCVPSSKLQGFARPLNGSIPSGYPKGNQDIVCLLLGKRRHKSSAGSPKIFDLLGCFSTMTLCHRSIRSYCRTRAEGYSRGIARVYISLSLYIIMGSLFIYYLRFSTLEKCRKNSLKIRIFS